MAVYNNFLRPHPLMKINHQYWKNKKEKTNKIMGKDHELLEAARNGNLAVIEKILYQKNKRSGPLARYVNSTRQCLSKI